MRINKNELEVLRGIVRVTKEAATMEGFGAGMGISQNPGETPTEFLRRGTELYRETWIIRRLEMVEEIIAMVETDTHDDYALDRMKKTIFS